MSVNRTADRDLLRCSFCNKAPDDLRQLIAGPTAYICSECVDVCVDVLTNDSKPEGNLPDSASQRLRVKAAAIFPDRSGTCSFCGKPGLSETLLPIESRGSLCGECADAIEDALRQGRPLIEQSA